MVEVGLAIAVILSGAAALFSLLAFLRAGDARGRSEIVDVVRSEQNRTNQIVEGTVRGLRVELASRLDAGIKTIGDSVQTLTGKMDSDISAMAKDAVSGRDILRATIEAKLDDASGKQAQSAKDAREEITSSFRKLGGDVRETLDRSIEEQKIRLQELTSTVSVSTEKQEKGQEILKETIERRLEIIRSANEAKLEEMRKTVDEKLQSTLETRLSENFKLVSDQLVKVAVGLGEMQQLATGVGDLKRVLTQVKPRGVWGEAQLGSLLEDFLAPDQFSRNVAVKPESSERVEFAIRLPKLSDGSGEVYLPIDAKFPHEDYQRLVAAAEIADAVAVEEASKALDRVLRTQAKDISTKYIAPPHTTDYAVLFVPSEALYAEMARRPGLIEAITRECSVMVAGPSNLIALLNAIRVGFRSALIHQQAGEVSKVLQRVRSEFDKYGQAVNAAAKRAASTVDAISKLQTRQNVMGRALKGVDLLSSENRVDAASLLLDLETSSSEAMDSAQDNRDDLGG